MNKIQKYIAKNLINKTVEVCNLTWPIDYNLNFYDVEVSMKFNDQVHAGRGGSFQSKDHFNFIICKCLLKSFPIPLARARIRAK